MALWNWPVLPPAPNVGNRWFIGGGTSCFIGGDVSRFIGSDASRFIGGGACWFIAGAIVAGGFIAADDLA